jgi:DNA-binding GntR family transcriptional regulator
MNLLQTPDFQIARMTLHDAVLGRLRDMIVEGELEPGARINEVHLGAQLGVSRTPLREAIKTLASEGLVEIAPARGAVVRKFSEQDVADILDVIKVLEMRGGKLACEHASDETIAAIVALHAQMLAAYEAGQRLEYFKLNQAIHTAIAAASGNACLAQMQEMLQARIRRIRYIGNRLPERWAGAVAEHEAMIKALAARNGEQLAEVLGRHLDHTFERARDAI